MAAVLNSLLVFTLFFVGARALTCFVNGKDGRVQEESNPSWRFCALIPFAEGGRGRLAGVGEENENLAPAEAVFGQNSRLYSVRTYCVLERYAFGEVNPAFGPEPEYLFRCLCNSDRCNSSDKFGAYLSALRH